jgi:hypothetical protein
MINNGKEDLKREKVICHKLANDRGAYCYKKMVDDKRNDGVVGRVNNQTPTLGPAREWNCACVISK